MNTYTKATIQGKKGEIKLEDTFLIVLVLLLDATNNTTREIIPRCTADMRTAGIATLFFFAFFIGILLIVPACLQIALYCYSKTIDYKTFALWFLQYVAVLFFFCGDNLEYAFDNYAKGVDCGSGCVYNIQLVAPILLGISTFLIKGHDQLFGKAKEASKDREETEEGAAIPKQEAPRATDNTLRPVLIFLNYIKKNPDEEENPTMYTYYALEMFALLVKSDAYYTILTSYFASDEYCSKRNMIFNWTFFASFIIYGLLVLFSKGVYATCKLGKDRIRNIVLMWIIVILLCLILPIYILADSGQPLDCTGECVFYAGNTTAMEALDCNRKDTKQKLRLIFTIVILLFLAIILIILGISKYLDGNTNGKYLLKTSKQSSTVKYATGCGNLMSELKYKV